MFLEADKRTSFAYVLITEQHRGNIGLSALGLTQNSDQVPSCTHIYILLLPNFKRFSALSNPR